MGQTIERFEIRVDDVLLEDLRDRSPRTCFTDQIEGSRWDDEMPVDDLRRLVTYRRETDDWRVHEATPDQLPHFPASIHGDGDPENCFTRDQLTPT